MINHFPPPFYLFIYLLILALFCPFFPWVKVQEEWSQKVESNTLTKL